MTWLLTTLLGVFAIDPANRAGESLDFSTPCTLDVAGCLLIEPVRNAHWNMNPGEGPSGLGTDTLSFTFRDVDPGECIFPESGSILPEMGTFYLTADTSLKPGDTLNTREPPHLVIRNTVQISIRPDDSYTGYMFELINTPFIMAPRTTPGGAHQSDSRLGTDCAGLAVYGRRRMGDETVLYLGPSGIIPMLERITQDEYLLTGGVFKTEDGEPAPAPERGDLLHFGEQVSIFLEDRGTAGILDVEDLLIQSWFHGPHVCPAESCGFTGNPVVLYRWK